jgi:hypothetical protein
MTPSEKSAISAQYLNQDVSGTSAQPTVTGSDSWTNNATFLKGVDGEDYVFVPQDFVQKGNVTEGYYKNADGEWYSAPTQWYNPKFLNQDTFKNADQMVLPGTDTKGFVWKQSDYNSLGLGSWEKGGMGGYRITDQLPPIGGIGYPTSAPDEYTKTVSYVSAPWKVSDNMAKQVFITPSGDNLTGSRGWEYQNNGWGWDVVRGLLPVVNLVAPVYLTVTAGPQAAQTYMLAQGATQAAINAAQTGNWEKGLLDVGKLYAAQQINQYVAGQVNDFLPVDANAIAKSMLTGATTSGLTAGIYGRDINKAFLTGGISGGVNAVASQIDGFQDLPKPVQKVFSAAVAAELQGKNKDQLTSAVLQSALTSGVAAIANGIAANAVYQKELGREPTAEELNKYIWYTDAKDTKKTLDSDVKSIKVNDALQSGSDTYTFGGVEQKATTQQIDDYIKKVFKDAGVEPTEDNIRSVADLSGGSIPTPKDVSDFQEAKQKAAEEQRISDEQKAEEQRIENARIEAQRIIDAENLAAENKRIAEENRIAEQNRIDQEYRAAEAQRIEQNDIEKAQELFNLSGDKLDEYKAMTPEERSQFKADETAKLNLGLNDGQLLEYKSLSDEEKQSVHDLSTRMSADEAISYVDQTRNLTPEQKQVADQLIGSFFSPEDAISYATTGKYTDATQERFDQQIEQDQRDSYSRDLIAQALGLTFEEYKAYESLTAEQQNTFHDLYSQGVPTDEALNLATQPAADITNEDKGVDTVEGGADTVSNGNGEDTLTGGEGKDTVEGGNDTVTGGEGFDTVVSGEGTDTVVSGEGTDTIQGGENVDTIEGGTTTDTIEGGDGTDTVEGGLNGQDDTLLNVDGEDTTQGGDTTDLGEVEIVGERPKEEVVGETCAEGYHWNGSMCVPDEDVVDTSETCPEGYVYDMALKQCVPIQKEVVTPPVVKPPVVIPPVVTPPVVTPPATPAPAAPKSPLDAVKLDTSPQFLSSKVMNPEASRLKSLKQLYGSLTPGLAHVSSEDSNEQENKQPELSEEEQAVLDANPKMTKDDLMQQQYGTRFFSDGGSSATDSGFSLDAQKFKMYPTSILAAAPLSEQQKSRLNPLQQLRSSLLSRQQGLANGGLPAKYAEAAPAGHKPEFITGLTGYYAQGKGTGQSDDIDAMLHDGDYVADADLVAALGDGSSKAGAEALEKFRRSIPHQEHAQGGAAVPAKIADGEYVFPASFVTAIGQGDNKAGAKVLDKMREAIRAHKRSAPTSKIPPKAKSPLDYLKMVKG